MSKAQKRSAIALALLLVLAFICMLGADYIQHGMGSIDISEGVLATEDGQLYYKMYTPKTATEEAPAPGVLLLHGYQNDHETCAAYAIELARRGYVVLAIDEFGHGKTVPGLEARGYVNKKVSVNFGEESEADGTFKKIGGTIRYRVLMNFSNLSFFDDKYTKDDAGNSIRNSAEGGIAAYKWLADLPNVDETRLGISGHSMGTWAAWSVAAAYSGATNEYGADIMPKATVLQCGELFRDSAYDSENIKFNNVLLLQAKYDEFSYFRDYQNTVSEELIRSPLRCEFLGTTPEEARWDRIYGYFSDGSARMIRLLRTNHRLTTHNAEGLGMALNWFDESMGTPEMKNRYANGGLHPMDQIAMTKEWLNLAALLLVLGAALALMDLLLETGFFKPLRQELPSRTRMLRGGKWWRSAIITMLIGGILYPFATQLGHALVPLPEHLFRMTVGNGLITWYSFIMLINLVILLVGRAKAKKKGQTLNWYEKGLGVKDKPGKLSWALGFRSLLLVLCIAGLVYAFAALCDAMFMLDLRIIWPMLGTFNAMRLGQFFLYICFFACYFVMVNAKAMATLRCEASYKPGFRGFMGSWWRSGLVMTGGILLIVLIEYIPFFAEIGPGADLLFGSTFGGPFMSLMILLLPQIVVYSLLGCYCYRRTGNAWIGGLFSGVLACWIVTGGSSFL